MKNLSLILNAVLIVAVLILFYLHFSSGKPSATASSEPANLGDSKIAYIRSDSVLKNYDYLKVQREALEAKTKKMDQDYRNRAIGLQNEIQAYQRNVSSMTLGQVRATEEDLGKRAAEPSDVPAVSQPATYGGRVEAEQRALRPDHSIPEEIRR
ncbi:MAG: OmpH family outer membrane protein [Chryseolinea sp.]